MRFEGFSSKFLTSEILFKVRVNRKFSKIHA